MIISSEVVVEGSYNYLQKNKLYSTENFKMSRRLESHSYFFEAEILSRIETGEFLKVKVFYELSPSMMPIVMKVEKSLGEKHSVETFEVNLQENQLAYEFASGGQQKRLVKHHTNKHYLTSPAVCTAAVFSLTKKFDNTGRTPIILVAGHNSWEVEEATPVENLVYGEFNNREAVDLKIGEQELEAHCLTIFNRDSLGATNLSEERIDLMLSKHFSIPYQLIDNDLLVEIKSLRRVD